MQLALSALQWSLCLVYLDDVIVFSRDFDKQVDYLDKVLTWLGSTGLKVEGQQVCVLCHKGVIPGAHPVKGGDPTGYRECGQDPELASNQDGV